MSEKIHRPQKNVNPQSLQQFLKNFLPKDPQELERIYKSIQNPQNALKKPKRITSDITSHASTDRIHYNTLDYTKSHNADYAIKRSRIMMKLIQDKLGVKIKNDQIAEKMGMKFYLKKIDSIIKPLQSNPDFCLSKNPAILRQLTRYYLNQKFYDNNIEDAEINSQDTYDKEMKEFIGRKKIVLSEIKARKNQESTLAGFSHVRSKFQSISLPRLPKYKASSLIQKTTRLFQACDKYRADCSLPKQMSINHFEGLKGKIYGEEHDDVEDSIVKTVKTMMERDFFDKSDRSYMKMMTPKEEPICRLNRYQKDLLQDQIKMRNILNFSDTAVNK